MIWFGWVLCYINQCRLFNAKFSLYICIRYMICKHILLITFLNDSELSFICTQLSGFKYCHVIIEINISHLFVLI